MAYHYLISLNDEGNTKRVFQGQQTNKFCLFVDFILTIKHFFSSDQSFTCLYTVNVAPSTDQLTGDIMNINEHDVIMLPGYYSVFCSSEDQYT